MMVLVEIVVVPGTTSGQHYPGLDFSSACLHEIVTGTYAVVVEVIT